jgi:hypothetical protein
MKLHSIAVVLLLTLSQAQWANAVFMDLQSGSLMGMVHASIGGTFSDNHHITTGVGYVPKLDNHEEMNMVSLRYRYQHPYQFSFKVKDRDYSLSPASFGVGFLVGSHKDLFVKLPDQYPDDYYQPTAIRVVFNYQSTLQINAHTQVYFDISVLDVGLVSYVREPDFFMDNYDYLGLDGITNWGFGLRHSF